MTLLPHTVFLEAVVRLRRGDDANDEDKNNHNRLVAVDNLEKAADDNSDNEDEYDEEFNDNDSINVNKRTTRSAKRNAISDIAVKLPNKKRKRASMEWVLPGV